MAEFEYQQRMLKSFAVADQKIYLISVLSPDSTTLQTLNLLLSDAEDSMKLFKIPLQVTPSLFLVPMNDTRHSATQFWGSSCYVKLQLIFDNMQ